MGVLHPVKLVITNYPEGKSETFTVENNPTDPASGTHEITFSRECWIEADDFMEVPVPKYKRLTPNGPECRLKARTSSPARAARRMKTVTSSSLRRVRPELAGRRSRRRPQG